MTVKKHQYMLHRVFLLMSIRLCRFWESEKYVKILFLCKDKSLKQVKENVNMTVLVSEYFDEC